MNLSENKEVVVRNIIRAVSYQGLDLRHFTPDLISKLVFAGKLMSVIDIFNLTLSDLIKYAGKEAADKILANPPSKIIPLPNFIYVLGPCLDDKGYQYKLAVKFTTLEAFLGASYNDIEAAVGPGWAATFFNTMPAKIVTAKKLWDLGFSVQTSHKKEFNGMFEEKNFAISGRLDTHLQGEIINIIVQAGGTQVHTIRETTDFLLTGQPDSKTLRDRVKRAQELNVPIIDYYQLKLLFRIYGIK